jgi:sec-independent protein translocase protein TatA
MRVGMGELLVIGLVILIVFGPQRLPEIGRAIGKAMREFQKAAKDIKKTMEEISSDHDDEIKGNDNKTA